MAGCVEETTTDPGASTVQIGLITPGVWHVNGTTDRMLVWMHNPTTRSVDVRWDVKMGDGSPLPPGWNLTASRTSAKLSPAGTKIGSGAATTYPDWQWSLLSLALPTTIASGEHQLKIVAGPTEHPFRLAIATPAKRVSGPGDGVKVQYEGRFNDTGQVFDPGTRPFDTELGSGQTVPGFDNGLMGLALGERVVLILPPALGYGYDQTHPSRTPFNGKTLRFTVSILEFQS